MTIKRSKFVTSLAELKPFPGQGLPEIALAGKSNVGKSSLINSLTRNGKLARTSSEPGKTRLVNFYQLNEDMFLVDLPGYGFAKTNRNNKEQWSGFISKYLSGSENLGLVCQLIDIRHKPLESDLECYQWLKECGLRVQVVLTKSDKLSKNAAMSQKALFKRELGLSEDEIITYTSSQHTNRSELINRIMAALVANGVEEEQA